MQLQVNPSIVDILACPSHGTPLRLGVNLFCASGCQFPVVDGIPVLLRQDAVQTLWVASASLKRALEHSPAGGVDLCLDTLGLEPQIRTALESAKGTHLGIDPVVNHMVLATNGNLYRQLVGRLPRYPIPMLRLPPGNGLRLLDIGCNWGRWSVAAARLGYDVIGIDPSLGAVLAARRVCRELGVEAQFVVADSRYLPFQTRSFDVVFSYSVLQHMAKEYVELSLSQVARVLRPSGTSLIQMANAWGIRSAYHLLRRGSRPARDFDVRYWTCSELKAVFERSIGPSSLEVDCYFGLGIQESDGDLFSPIYRTIVVASRLLRRVSERVPALRFVADSLYIRSHK